MVIKDVGEVQASDIQLGGVGNVDKSLVLSGTVVPRIPWTKNHHNQISETRFPSSDQTSLAGNKTTYCNRKLTKETRGGGSLGGLNLSSDENHLCIALPAQTRIGHWAMPRSKGSESPSDYVLKTPLFDISPRSVTRWKQNDRLYGSVVL